MRCEMTTTKNPRSRSFEKKEKKEKKEEKCETTIDYAKGLSHAVLKYLEEEETKALTEKIAEGKKKKNNENNNNSARGDEEKEEENAKEKKKRTTKTKTKKAVCAVSSEGGAGGLDDIEGNGEEKNAEMKTTKKSKSKKTPMPAFPSEEEEEEEEEKEKKAKRDSGVESGSLSRLGSAFKLIQLQVIDPAEMILAGKGKKSDGEKNNGGVHDSPREVHQSPRRHEVLSVDGSAQGTPTQTKSFVEAGTSPMEHHQQQQQQQQKQKQQLLLQHQPLVRMDKGTNTDSKPQHGDKKIMLKEMPRRVWRSKSFTKKGRKHQGTEFGVIKDNLHNEVVKTAETVEKRTTESEIRPPTRSDSFKKRRRESIRKQLLMSAKASIVENMRTHSQPNLVQYQTQREREEERERISLDFNEFLDDAFVCATDVTYAAAETENDNNNILHYPRSASFANIASFWKKCEGKEGEEEKDDDNNDGNDEKMDITITAQSPHQPRRRQKICDCKECVTALMEHAAKVGRFVVAQEEEEKRQRVKEQRQKKTTHRQGTSSAVVATNLPTTTTTTTTMMPPTTKLMPADPNFLRPPPLLLASEGITTGTFDFAPNPLLTASTFSPLPALLDIIGATTAPNTNKCGASPGALLVDSFVMSPLLDQLPLQKQESG
jgi:hypothetical protein